MIEIENLMKRYGRFVAIEDISFSVDNGTVYGLVGYNGAGKTTLLKTVSGAYLPNAGRVTIDGFSPYGSRDPGRTPFIVADEPYFIPQATPDSMRGFYAGYYPAWSDATYKNLLALFGLDGSARIGGFSKGMQRQTGILLGLATGARTLLLDESFDGLDLGKRNLLKRLLRNYAQVREAAVILSSHNLRELEDVADRLGMIEDHHLMFDEPVDDLHARFNKYRIMAPCEQSTGVLAEILAGVADVRWARKGDPDGEGAEFTFTAEGDPSEIVKTLQEQWPKCGIVHEMATLEEIFLTDEEVNGHDIERVFV